MSEQKEKILSIRWRKNFAAAQAIENALDEVKRAHHETYGSGINFAFKECKKPMERALRRAAERADALANDLAALREDGGGAYVIAESVAAATAARFLQQWKRDTIPSPAAR